MYKHEQKNITLALFFNRHKINCHDIDIHINTNGNAEYKHVFKIRIGIRYCIGPTD